MSRLSEILGVKEGQEFRFEDDIQVYRINKNRRQYLCSDCWNDCASEINLSKMIAHPELIHPIPEKPRLTEQQITAIKGRIAEGTPWAARGVNEKTYLCFYKEKPKLSANKTYFTCLDKAYSDCFSDLYDFITFENSPVYLPELVEGSEEDHA